VSDKNGEAIFHTFWGPGMNWDACSALETDPHMVAIHKPMIQREETYKVPTRTLDTILEEQKLMVIDLLLVDVEGCEDKVFAEFNLKKWQPKVICVEQWEHKGQTLRPLLENHGYTHVLRIANNDDLYVRFDW
jgi:FkbM family methyltransferase